MQTLIYNREANAYFGFDGDYLNFQDTSDAGEIEVGNPQPNPQQKHEYLEVPLQVYLRPEHRGFSICIKTF